MTKTNHQKGGGQTPPRPQRNISVRAVRRQPADYRKLARALIAIAEAEAAAQQQAVTPPSKEVA
ncbi:MAG: hypothetical protein JWM34_472 [Ilumatobacteraceae bacterium]|nr:hypothetical protein [Ilumatobacteraceae bacterium]